MRKQRDPVRQPGTPAVRLRDAATLIIYRVNGAGTVAVLMGERHRKHRFLPQRYVFPGGQVDPHDSRVRSAAPMRGDVEALLTRKATPARARALVAAAVRETFEETGLVIGAPDPAPGKPVPANWRTFFATGMAPAFDRLSYIARAVTPATRPMRFNARFFMIDAAHTTGDLGGDGELLNLTFMPLARTRHLELPRITARVLSSVEELALRPPAPSSVQTVPFWRHINGTHVRIDE